jgi:hypothetical protein
MVRGYRKDLFEEFILWLVRVWVWCCRVFALVMFLLDGLVFGRVRGYVVYCLVFSMLLPADLKRFIDRGGNG